MVEPDARPARLVATTVGGRSFSASRAGCGVRLLLRRYQFLFFALRAANDRAGTIDRILSRLLGSHPGGAAGALRRNPLRNDAGSRALLSRRARHAWERRSGPGRGGAGRTNANRLPVIP